MTTMTMLDDPTSRPLGHPMHFAMTIMVQILKRLSGPFRVNLVLPVA